MTVGSIKKFVRKIWDAIPISETVISRVKSLCQGQTNGLDFLDRKNGPIGELKITGMNVGETEAPNIKMIKPQTGIDPTLAGAETPPELLNRQYIPTIEQEHDRGITKTYGTLESAEQRIDSAVPYVL